VKHPDPGPCHRHAPGDTPGRFVRQITTFVQAGDGSRRRDDEIHPNVLIDTATVPVLLAEGPGHGGLRVRNRAAAHRTVCTDRTACRLTSRHPGHRPIPPAALIAAEAYIHPEHGDV
jgi:hypothetical protein